MPKIHNQKLDVEAKTSVSVYGEGFEKPEIERDDKQSLTARSLDERTLNNHTFAECLLVQ